MPLLACDQGSRATRLVAAHQNRFGARPQRPPVVASRDGSSRCFQPQRGHRVVARSHPAAIATAAGGQGRRLQRLTSHWAERPLGALALASTTAVERGATRHRAGVRGWSEPGFPDAISGSPATHLQDPVTGSGIQGLENGGPASVMSWDRAALLLGSGQVIDELHETASERSTVGGWDATTWCGGDRRVPLSAGCPCWD
jgi:hypothetical protein